MLNSLVWKLFEDILEVYKDYTLDVYSDKFVSDYVLRVFECALV